MARLTIEDKWWTDPRRSKLIKLLGDEDSADLAAVRLWKLAQRFWGDGHRPIPAELFEMLEAAPRLVEAKLAVVEPEGVYARGSRDFLSWLDAARKAASIGGKKSAEARRKKSGSAQPNAKNPEANPNHPRSELEATSSEPEPSVSGSVSGSGLDDEEVAKHSIGKMEARFNPEAPQYLDALKKLGVEGSLRNNLAELLTRFRAFDEFKEWANGLLASSEKKHFETKAELTRYITASIKKEIGAS